MAIAENAQLTAHEARVSARPKSRSAADRWFYVILTMLVPSLLNPSTRTVPLPLTSLDLAHVVVSVTWLLVFMAQVTLVAAGRVTVHRQLGVLGVLLSAAFIVVTRVWEHRIHPVSLWGAIFSLQCQSVFLEVFPRTAVWRNFAAWAVQ